MRRLIARVSGAVVCCLALVNPGLHGAQSGQSVVVVYNSLMQSSKDVAGHYAAVRSVPAQQIIGLNLPEGETMTRAEYRDGLENPLLAILQEKGLLVYATPLSDQQTNVLKPASCEVRYVVLCIGVPLRIAEDASLYKPGDENLPEALRRNGAAVDSELCLLPWRDPNRVLAGPSTNPWFGTANSTQLDPRNGLLMVTRLDGPNPEIARQLVDKAMEAETNGLWGRAYFDLRGLTNGAYKKGDDWIAAAAGVAQNYGFETVVDQQPETFSAAFPMSQIALYAGWYDGTVSGPFARPRVEFMPGAFAYHLHSFSAHTLRSTNSWWSGPLLAAGVTATMGCIDEPYLDGTPSIGVFFDRWLLAGFTFGEAAYACQQTLSWQTTVIGDPLYQPFGRNPRTLDEALRARHNPLLAWSQLRFVNLNLLAGAKRAEMARYLTGQEITSHSAVLQEKLAGLYESMGQYDSAVEACRRALQLDPSPQQKVRLTFSLATLFSSTDNTTELLALYDHFIKETPDYPDALSIYQKLEALASQLNKRSLAAAYAREIKKLTPPPPK